MRRPILLLLSIGILIAGVWLFYSNSQQAPTDVVQNVTMYSPADRQIFSSYGGSSSCKKCHEEEYNDWKFSHHALAERPPEAEIDNAAFNPSRTFNHGTQHSDIGITLGNYQVTSLGLSNTYEPHKVSRVIGTDPLRQYLVNYPGGRYQTLEASYDPNRNEWFNVYGNEDRKPGEWGHWTGRGMNWNSMCADCHNTRLLKNYDPATDTYATAMAEMSVGCEACHGPMKEHNEWRKVHPDTTAVDPTIKPFSPNQHFETCASCHSRRVELSGDFIPGDAYDDHFSLTVVDETETYYPDGQVREEDYEYAAFLGSRMYKSGVRCIDCHQPHTGKTRLPGNILCMRCHDGAYPNSPIIIPQKHSHHRVDSLYENKNGIDLVALEQRNRDSVINSGNECVNCHMPQTNYMQRHRRHDHGFTIPDPLVTRELGIPNACNRCHTDKSTKWAEDWTNKWYGKKMERPSRTRTQIIAHARQGRSEARDGLIALTAGKETPYWKAVAAGLLERWSGDQRATSTLVRLSRDIEPIVRSNAVRALGSAPRYGSTNVSQVLHERLQDPVRSVRFFAASALRDSLSPKTMGSEEFLHTLTIATDQPLGQMQLGSYEFARGNGGEALTHYQKAVEWDPNSAPIRHDFAIVLSSLNRMNEAISQLEAACRLDTLQAEYQFKLGLALNESGQSERSIEALRRAVTLDDHHARAWYNLGLSLSAIGKTADALDALHHAEVADPTDPRSPYASATILIRLGKTPEARAAARRALEIMPTFTPASEFLRSLN